MAHVQEQILFAVKAALDAAGIVGPNGVFVDRLDPLQANELPGILIEEAPQGERAEASTVHGMEQRDLYVRIAGVVQHSSQYAVRARQLGLEIEKVLGNPVEALDRLARGGRRITLSQLITSGEGDTALAGRQQYWLFTYFVLAGSPTRQSEPMFHKEPS